MSRTEARQGGAPSIDRMSRDALVERWLALTRDVLPGMAAAERWPIRFDHCFMRVCLDAAVGAPWTRTVRRPAIRHLDDRQLAAAVDVAETIAARPGTLVDLNARSLAGRRAALGTARSVGPDAQRLPRKSEAGP